MKKSKQAKKNKKAKKAKETKEENRLSPENQLKKQICTRPGEDFSNHPHFWKQEIFFDLTPVPEFQSSGLQERDSGTSVFL